MRFQQIVTFGSLAVILLVGGLAAGFFLRHSEGKISREVVKLLDQIDSYADIGRVARRYNYVKAEVAAADPRVKILQPEKFLPGYRVVMGVEPDLVSYALTLIDATGAELHKWPIRYQSLVAETWIKHGINPHGLEIFPDGSIAVNFDGNGDVLARINACGAPVWVADGIYHHSLHLDQDGLLWTWVSPENVEAPQQSIVALEAATGAVVKEIDIFDIVAAAERNGLLLSIPPDYKIRRFTPQVNVAPKHDAFHPNDVEPLPRGLADQYPLFDAGDLVISLRNIDFVGVVDPDTLEIKWSGFGPWIKQHDPDFIGDGVIEIYDNNIHRGRSNLIAVNPATGEMTRRFLSPESHFYSRIQGKHQRLPNGASLVTVPGEGRVMEIDSEGRPIMIYDNIADDGLNGRVFNAIWVPEDFFETLPNCPG